MQMSVNENRKTVEIWLTRAERDNPAFMESLKPIYKKYREQLLPDVAIECFKQPWLW